MQRQLSEGLNQSSLLEDGCGLDDHVLVFFRLGRWPALRGEVVFAAEGSCCCAPVARVTVALRAIALALLEVRLCIQAAALTAVVDSRDYAAVELGAIALEDVLAQHVGLVDSAVAGNDIGVDHVVRYL